jgi:hypothetical protein
MRGGAVLGAPTQDDDLAGSGVEPLDQRAAIAARQVPVQQNELRAHRRDSGDSLVGRPGLPYNR